MPALLGFPRFRSVGHVQQAAHGSYSTNATTSFPSCPLVLGVPVSSCHSQTWFTWPLSIFIKKPATGVGGVLLGKHEGQGASGAMSIC